MQGPMWNMGLRHSFMPIPRYGGGSESALWAPGLFGYGRNPRFMPGAGMPMGMGFPMAMAQAPQGGFNWGNIANTGLSFGVPIAAGVATHQLGKRLVVPALSRFIPVAPTAGRVGMLARAGKAAKGLGLGGLVAWNLGSDLVEAAGLMPGRFGQFGWDLDETLRSTAFNPEYSRFWNWAGTLANSFNTIGSPKYTSALVYGAYDARRASQEAWKRNVQLDQAARLAQQQGRLQHWRGETPRDDWKRRWWRAFWQSF